jgi:hypothetical protein
MKWKYTCRIALALAVFFTFSRCSEDVKPTPVTYTQLLTGKESKSWRLNTIRIIDDGEDSGNLSSRQVFDNCVADDLYVFYANDLKTFEAQEGASKCNPADPEVFVEDTWSLVNATATLTFVMPILTTEGALPFVIKNLTENTLTLEFYAGDVNLSYRFTFTVEKG